MSKPKIFFTQDFYLKHLSIINTVHFTNREIDVISCLLHGRRTSKIASLLSIDPRTVDTHIRNIMVKLECNARERIIDFMEVSDKITLLRNYYELLQNELMFEKILSDISKSKKDKISCCVLTQEQEQDQGKDSFIAHLKSHLNLVGISASIAAREKKANYTLFVFLQMPKSDEISLHLKEITKRKNKVIVILPEMRGSKVIPKELVKFDCVDFSREENYFFSFFSILRKILPDLDLDKIMREFKGKYKSIEIFQNLQLEAAHQHRPENRSIYQRWGNLASVFALIFLMGCGFLIWNKKYNETYALRSDLLILTESAFLNRPELMTQIDQSFKENKGIQTIAVVGIGGSGKTTLARQYARQQKANVIWEVNAETPVSLSESFKNLAQALAKTDEDKKLLREFLETRLSIAREKRLIEFVKDRLKLHSGWFLIYDNVEDFAAIQAYFPIDISTWGKGRILLTTRNHNIQNNKQVNGLILTGELTATQKLDLFMKIMQQGKEHNLPMQENKNLIEFLKQLPPFPLDISAAAYYLKTLNISYDQYLESLRQQDKDFTVVQENLLNEGGDYQKTRWAIITRSLEYLIKKHKDFPDLLLLISLLDSQNISKELLDKYKNSGIVDNFIYHLKKHSLISTSPSESSYSIHRSTQAIALSYLEKLFALNEKSPILKEIVYVLDDYADKHIEQENFPKLQIMARHLEKVLSHSHMLTDFSKGLLGSKLGGVYYYLNNDKTYQTIESTQKLVNNNDNYKDLSSEEKSRLARSLIHIGAVYTELRLYPQAQELLEKAANIYGKGGLNNNAELSWVLSHLGNVYRRMGNYEKARDYLERSIQLHKQYGADNKRIIRALSCLGSAYRGLGSYEKSIEVLEESLNLCEKYYPHDHFRIGKILKSLGTVYRKLGDYKKSKKYIESSLVIFKKHFPENHVNIGLTFAYLGNCLRKLGEYEKSLDCLEQSLKIHQKYFGENHAVIGWISLHLAKTYKALGKHQGAHNLFDKVLEIYDKNSREENIETARLQRDMAEIYLEKNCLDVAKNCIKKSLNILDRRNHVDVYKSREVLGEIYLKQSIQSSSANNSHESQIFKNQAIDQFKQALKIAEQHFPQSSVHIQRIHSKINSIKKDL